MPKDWNSAATTINSAAALDRICQQANLRWWRTGGSICIGEDWPRVLREAEQRTPLAVKSFSAGQDYWERFLLSLTPEQLRLLERGEPLNLPSLLAEQAQILRTVSDNDVRMRPLLPKLLAGGKMTVYLQAGAYVFWRGRLVETNQQSEGQEWLRLRPLDILGPDWAVLRKVSEQCVAAHSKLRLTEVRSLGLGELPSLIKGATGGKVLTIAALLKDEKVFVSPGDWDVRHLLTLIQGATGTELRSIDKLAYLAPSASHRTSKDRGSYLELEARWQTLRSVLTTLVNSPLSTLQPTSANVLLDPKLTQYRRLRPEEKKWIEVESDPGPPAPQFRESADMECCFFPMVRLVLVTADGTSLGRGFGPSLNYRWVANRSRIQSAGQP